MAFPPLPSAMKYRPVRTAEPVRSADGYEHTGFTHLVPVHGGRVKFPNTAQADLVDDRVPA